MTNEEIKAFFDTYKYDFSYPWIRTQLIDHGNRALGELLAGIKEGDDCCTFVQDGGLVIRARFHPDLSRRHFEYIERARLTPEQTEEFINFARTVHQIYHFLGAYEFCYLEIREHLREHGRDDLAELLKDLTANEPDESRCEGECLVIQTGGDMTIPAEEDPANVKVTFTKEQTREFLDFMGEHPWSRVVPRVSG